MKYKRFVYKRTYNRCYNRYSTIDVTIVMTYILIVIHYSLPGVKKKKELYWQLGRFVAPRHCDKKTVQQGNSLKAKGKGVYWFAVTRRKEDVVD